MARTSCPACGATVDVALIPDGGTVPLETHPDASNDAPRYRVTGHRHGTMLAEPVAPGAVGDFRADHRFDCPGANAGRR